MSMETNKALVRRWVEEVLNTPGNLAVIDELFAPTTSITPIRPIGLPVVKDIDKS